MLLGINTFLNRKNLNQNEKLYEVCGKGNINMVKNVLDQKPSPDINWKSPVSCSIYRYFYFDVVDDDDDDDIYRI